MVDQSFQLDDELSASPQDLPLPKGDVTTMLPPWEALPALLALLLLARRQLTPSVALTWQPPPPPPLLLLLLVVAAAAAVVAAAAAAALPAAAPAAAPASIAALTSRGDLSAAAAGDSGRTSVVIHCSVS
jgi:hypothetical protein